MSHPNNYESGHSRTSSSWSLVQDDEPDRQASTHSRKRIPVVLEYDSQSVMTLKSDSLQELVYEGRREFGLTNNDLEVSVGIELGMARCEPNGPAPKSRVVRITEKVYNQLGPLSVLHFLVYPHPAFDHPPRRAPQPTVACMAPPAMSSPTPSPPVTFVKLEPSPEKMHPPPPAVLPPPPSTSSLTTDLGSTTAPRRFLINSLATRSSPATQRPHSFPFFNRRLTSQPLSRPHLSLRAPDPGPHPCASSHQPSPLSCSSSLASLVHISHPASPPPLLRSPISLEYSYLRSPYSARLSGGRNLSNLVHGTSCQAEYSASGYDPACFSGAPLTKPETSEDEEHDRSSRKQAGWPGANSVRESVAGPIRSGTLRPRRSRQLTECGARLGTNEFESSWNYTEC